MANAGLANKGALRPASKTVRRVSILDFFQFKFPLPWRCELKCRCERTSTNTLCARLYCVRIVSIQNIFDYIKHFFKSPLGKALPFLAQFLLLGFARRGFAFGLFGGRRPRIEQFSFLSNIFPRDHLQIMKRGTTIRSRQLGPHFALQNQSRTGSAITACDDFRGWHVLS